MQRTKETLKKPDIYRAGVGWGRKSCMGRLGRPLCSRNTPRHSVAPHPPLGSHGQAEVPTGVGSGFGLPHWGQVG